MGELLELRRALVELGLTLIELLHEALELSAFGGHALAALAQLPFLRANAFCLLLDLLPLGQELHGAPADIRLDLTTVRRELLLELRDRLLALGQPVLALLQLAQQLSLALVELVLCPRELGL